jgi:DNA adenine methylase
MAQPFVKWAGGKRQLLNDLVRSAPKDLAAKGNRCYAEPFVGGGALLFKLFELGYIDRAIICDFNQDLILTYRTIKHDVDGLIESLRRLNGEYMNQSVEDRREIYFQYRDEFNENRLTLDYDAGNGVNIRQASLFIYLNKTGFNGMFRVNRAGGFNVPPSNLADKDFTQEDNLRAVSKVLESVEIFCGDYQSALVALPTNCFVYFDPPYRPLTPTSFTTYIGMDWSSDFQQTRLAEYCKALHEKGHKFMMSNSDQAQRDEEHEQQFFHELFPKPKFNIQSVDANRAINSDGTQRGPVKEILVRNYKN